MVCPSARLGAITKRNELRGSDAASRSRLGICFAESGHSLAPASRWLIHLSDRSHPLSDLSGYTSDHAVRMLPQSGGSRKNGIAIAASLRAMNVQPR